VDGRGRRGPCRIEVTRDPCDARGVLSLLEFTGFPCMGVLVGICLGIAIGSGA